VIEIGAYEAPAGTVTSSKEDVAAFTTALTAPKYTVFLASGTLKLAPWRVTLDPMSPDIGEMEERIGGKDWTFGVSPGIGGSAKSKACVENLKMTSAV
jgi:hypothetical protein